MQEDDLSSIEDEGNARVVLRQKGESEVLTQGYLPYMKSQDSTLEFKDCVERTDLMVRESPVSAWQCCFGCR
ncbi:hypothetical protein chiPu_0019821 [Chiloscyllium punctatum]|uniref:Uncharacterized protein n=1 Tax=Chiloscyllium punctatum TaxID=137246 RepID=A0A401RT76_CHIPU|nr:hypothetical protein [Chiloscyllium punctatum]